MWKAAFAGVIALTFLGTGLAAAEDATRGITPPGPSQVTSSSIDQRLAQVKAGLRLTAEQEKHWPAVESAVRAVMRREASEAPAAPSLLQRAGARASAVAKDAVALKRIVKAAQPLLRSLDPEQRRAALSLARSLGLGHYAAAF